LAAAAAGTLIALSAAAAAQPSSSRSGREIFRDADGNAISNNEFVDIRMANPTYPDATITRRLEDGTVEFRLQKVPQEGMAAPPLHFKTIDGKKLTSESLRGKVVVLNLWFIGCPACYRQEGIMNEMRARFESVPGVEFIAVTADTAAAVKDYIRARPTLLQQAADAKAVVDEFRTAAFPRSVVIGRDGRIAYWRTTIHSLDKFESVIRAELAK
jgi:peroxiredoxin